jgi:hypothetical protein
MIKWLFAMGKRLTIGFVLVIVLAAVGLAGGWIAKTRASKPPSGVWNPAAIGGSFAGIRVQEADPANASVLFFYDLDNKSGADYNLAGDANLIVMGRLKSTGSLSPEHQYHLASTVFLPAGNRTRITLERTEPFRWPAQMDAASEAQFRNMVSRAVADLGGFVLFDPTTHYQIELPGSWPAVPAAASILQN